MPLSKERKRLAKVRLGNKEFQPKPSRVIPNWVVQPNVYLQPMAVQPKSMVVQPNEYLRAQRLLP